MASKVIEGLTVKDWHNGEITNTNFSRDAAIINDDPNINDEERERQLKSLAKDAGFRFVFV